VEIISEEVSVVISVSTSLRRFISINKVKNKKLP
jgi:hypothetical protein